MTTIANPIYDAAFKFLMEDQKVAKILLSALLKKEVIELETLRHEYTSMEQNCIPLFCISFTAKVRDKDGKEDLILIELQKTWFTTEPLRFRKYLGTQYIDKENVAKRKEKEATSDLPIVSIYILGHKLSALTEPIIYVRHYLDYGDNELRRSDSPVEILTHDTIIVQIPYLQGCTHNHLKQILKVFDQDYRLSDNNHYLEIDEENLSCDAQYLANRLLKAAASPAVRREMEIEDEILLDITDRNATIAVKNKEIEQHKQVIEQKEQMLQSMATILCQKGMTTDEIQALLQKNRV